MKVIETVDLTKYYGKARGIKQLTFSVDEGEMFGFIGPNGAGKSTTIKTLLGLLNPTSGHACVMGLNIRKYRMDILKQVGYMPSECNFWNGMTVEEVLKMSANLRKIDCKKERDALYQAFQISPYKKIDQLSLGNKKKVNIIAAMQHKPPLYILDEPTSGLDPLMQKTFFTLLKERIQGGATVFLSSHVLSEVAKHCERTAILRDGNIVKLEKVCNLTHTKIRRIILRGISSAPEINTMKDVKIEDNTVSFLFTGDMKELIYKLQGLDISDMTITEPDLDEIVMHYYEGELI